MIGKLLREPLLHFLLLGIGLFILFGLVRGEDGQARGEIVISLGTIEHLKATFSRTWQRLPTQEELDDLIADRIREEVFYREATALGLDRDDIIVRRRLRQKMEFLADDVAEQMEPSDVELRAYMERDPASYRTPDRFTFQQIYLDPQRYGDRLPQEADRLLAYLNGAGRESGAATLGDRLMLPSELRQVAADEVAGMFGDPFAEQLGKLEVGRWQGPVASGYGAHLVLLEVHEEGRMPSLEQVRDRVERDWKHERRQEVKDELFRSLLSHYTVRVESADTAVGQDIVRNDPQ